MSIRGQTIKDRFNAAKYTLAGQALSRCICKATTEELRKPKKKHLDYLAACTYQPNVSMQELATLLIERTNHSNWVVVYKALITVHHLMSYGSEKFTQYLASSNYSFQLNNFLDRIVAKGYAMSTFIRRYSNYINQKALSYRTLALDLCKTKRKLEDSVLRRMPIERLLETLPVIHKQLTALLDFGCTPEELNNSIIVASFSLLFHDAILLFASYNDGTFNMFEKYFDLNKKMCREAFEEYKKFLSCMDKVAEFLKVAKAADLATGDLPDFKRAPSSLIDALEEHLINLESNKKRETKIEVDTKLVALPSFTANSNFDVASSSRKSPNLGDMSREFESQLTFATGDEDFASHFDDDRSKIHPTTEPTDKKIWSLDSSITPGLGKSQSTIDDLDRINSNDIFTSVNKSPFDVELLTSNSAKNDLFDTNPPGFSNGPMLKPEALQISMNPSIDPRTQQQLIQIRREQVASRQNNNNLNSNSNNTSRPSKSHSTNNKPSRESMFEDLEKTMRQSLMKTENS